jgi:hypothetical protein
LKLPVTSFPISVLKRPQWKRLPRLQEKENHRSITILTARKKSSRPSLKGKLMNKMKTRIMLVSALTLMIISVQSLQAQFEYGVHAGMNLETQAKLGQLWDNCDLYQGYLLGGFIEYKAFKNISFQTELNYQKKGDKTISKVEETNSVTKREFNYLSVPLLIKTTVHDSGLGERYDLSFFAGPYAGYLTSANSKVKLGGTTSNENIENVAEKFDTGVVLGGGVKYKLGNGGAIIAELRYEMGLSKIDKKDPDLRNKGIGITLGYRF